MICRSLFVQSKGIDFRVDMKVKKDNNELLDKIYIGIMKNKG